VLVLYDHVDLRVSNLGEIRLLYADPDSVGYYRPGYDRSNAFLGLVLDPLHRPNGTRVALRVSDRAATEKGLKSELSRDRLGLHEEQ
jgi:hypothetical protein